MLVVLMGWQFAVSEFVGGIIMIVLLATLGGVVVARAPRGAGPGAPAGGGGRARAPSTAPARPADGSDRPCVKVRLRSVAGWADSATYTMSDLTMVRRELVIGYTVAGFLAVAGADVGVAGSLHHRARVLDQRGERHRRPVHRHHQLRLLHRQRAPGGGAVERGHLLRRRDRLHLRRPDRVPAPPDLPPLLRDAADAPHAGGLLGPDVDRRAAHGAALPRRRPGADGAADHDRAGALLLELHHLPEPDLPGALRRPVLALPQSGAARCAGTATRGTRCAACRWRRRTRRRRAAAPASSTTSAPTAAPNASTPTQRRAAITPTHGKDQSGRNESASLERLRAPWSRRPRITERRLDPTPRRSRRLPPATAVSRSGPLP